MSLEKENKEILEKLKRELKDAHWSRLEYIKYLRSEIEKYESV
tara:strand:+ start:114 stop:242 length:129 start_codon:yes stop_codon:yes gene_type:complete